MEEEFTMDRSDEFLPHHLGVNLVVADVLFTLEVITGKEERPPNFLQGASETLERGLHIFQQAANGALWCMDGVLDDVRTKAQPDFPVYSLLYEAFAGPEEQDLAIKKMSVASTMASSHEMLQHLIASAAHGGAINTEDVRRLREVFQALQKECDQRSAQSAEQEEVFLG